MHLVAVVSVPPTHPLHRHTPHPRTPANLTQSTTPRLLMRMELLHLLILLLLCQRSKKNQRIINPPCLHSLFHRHPRYYLFVCSGFFSGILVELVLIHCCVFLIYIWYMYAYVLFCCSSHQWTAPSWLMEICTTLKVM